MKIKNTIVESTPFVKIVITDKARKGKQVAWIALYWSAAAGIYGHQVCFQGNFGAGNFFEGKTGGWGYSKEAQALRDCLTRILGKRPYSCHYEAHYLLREFNKGGNYYQLSLAQLKKVCKARR